MASERRRRGFPLFPAFLIALGVLLLLQTTGALPWELWWSIWRLWPVLIIALGINIAFGGRMPWLVGTLVTGVLMAIAGIGIALTYGPSIGTETVTFTSLREPLEGVETVDVNIDIGAGKLVIDSLPPSSAVLVEADLRGWGAETFVNRSGNHAELRFSTGGMNFNFFGDTERRWDVRLSSSPSISIDLDAGASDLTLDLRGLNVRDLSIDGGASDIEILAPENAGQVNVDIDVGAANVDIVIPELVSARIDADVFLGGLSINELRFPRTGDVYMSRDFNTSANRVNLVIDGGASSVAVR